MKNKNSSRATQKPNRVSGPKSRKPSTREGKGGRSEFMTRSIPMAFANSSMGTEATFRQTANNTLRVRHHEYMGDVAANADGSFKLYNWAIQPGNRNSFPWLSGIANAYEKYRFHSLRFFYRAKCSTALAGSAISCIDYDVNDNLYTAKTDMMQSNYVDSNIWDSHTYACNIRNLTDFGREKYVRDGTQLSTDYYDLKTYDIGRFNLCLIGSNTTSAGGEVHVEYDVELITPQANSTLTPGANSSKVISGGGSVTNTQIFGAVPVIQNASGEAIGKVINNVTDGTPEILFNKTGEYVLNLLSQGTGFTTPPNVTAGVGGQIISQYAVLNNLSGSATQLVREIIMRVTSLPQTGSGQIKLGSVPGVTLTSSELRNAAYLLT